MYELSSEEKKHLLEISRSSLNEIFGIKVEGKPNISANLDCKLQNLGAFVTLYVKGNLRGCVGRMKSKGDLEPLIRSMTISSATKDNRFKPINKDELNHLKIEISIVSEMEEISSIDQFDLSKHGIYIKHGEGSGTFLPQVAKETGWDKEELLGRCSRDKAGIGWDGWKNADLFVYEVISFYES